MYATQLKTAEFGRTGMHITRVGVGAWASGPGGDEFEWGPPEEAAIAAIQRAVEAGVNWVDTYGFGRSEELVGRALEGMTDRPFVFTKCSLPEAPPGATLRSLERDSLLGQIEASIKRLQVDAIDLYQIDSPRRAPDMEEGWAALAELKEQGLVRHIGVTRIDVAQVRRIQDIAPVETVQPSYSLVVREAEGDILPFAQRDGIGVTVSSPMASGLLTGAMTRARVARLADDDWRKRDARFQEPQLSQHLALVERVRVVAGRHDTTLGAVAIAWTLANPAVHAAVVGLRRPDQVDPLLPAAGLALTADDLAYLENTAPW